MASVSSWLRNGSRRWSSCPHAGERAVVEAAFVPGEAREISPANVARELAAAIASGELPDAPAARRTVAGVILQTYRISREPAAAACCAWPSTVAGIWV
jgi:hypothetical protein